MNWIDRPSPNQDARPAGTVVDTLVLHYTGMESAEAALVRLTDPAAQVSAHYTIDEDGTVYGHVPEDRRAWHAGVSYWAGARDINARSIGVELVNPGHAFGYRPFTEPQFAALTTLCHSILMRHPIPSARVLAHSDIAPMRKEDPGELLRWERLARAGIGLWPEKTQSAVGADALPCFGYDPDATAEKSIIAFQRHFRPKKLNGQWDGECAGLLAGLLEKLRK
jgi:N-acetylmuramoyl-L-alanine amidase